jgi:hypothetical protein
VLDDSLQIDETLAGVAEPFSGGEINGERIAVTAPVAESGTMTENDARRDFSEAIVPFDVRLRKIRDKGNIEAEFALID